jgi:hypothetical protein
MIPEKLQKIMEKFSWLRATLAVTIETATQTW